MPNLYTHQKPDLDALASLWATIRFVPGMADADIQFKSNNWDGSDMDDGDMVVDMNAGGHGIKGRKTNDHVMSAFALLMDTYAPKHVHRAMAPFIAYLDSHDSRGSVIKQLAPHLSLEQNKMLYFSSIHMALFAAKNVLMYDKEVFEHMCIYFDGMLMAGSSQLRNEDDILIYTQSLYDGKIAINRSGRRGMTHTLFEHKVDIVIYIKDYDIGIVRGSHVDIRMDHPDILAIIESAGEITGEGINQWFCHPAGFLCAHGTETGHASKASKVSPYDLAETLANLL